MVATHAHASVRSVILLKGLRYDMDIQRPTAPHDSKLSLLDRKLRCYRSIERVGEMRDKYEVAA